MQLIPLYRLSLERNLLKIRSKLNQLLKDLEKVGLSHQSFIEKIKEAKINSNDKDKINLLLENLSEIIFRLEKNKKLVPFKRYAAHIEVLRRRLASFSLNESFKDKHIKLELEVLFDSLEEKLDKIDELCKDKTVTILINEFSKSESNLKKKMQGIITSEDEDPLIHSLVFLGKKLDEINVRVKELEEETIEFETKTTAELKSNLQRGTIKRYPHTDDFDFIYTYLRFAKKKWTEIYQFLEKPVKSVWTARHPGSRVHLTKTKEGVTTIELRS